MGVGKTQINHIVKEKTCILEGWELAVNGERRYVKTTGCFYSDLNDKVLRGLCAARLKNITVTGALILEKALMLSWDGM